MSFDEESAKIEDIIESIVTDEEKEVNLAFALELAERINQSKDERKIGVETLRNFLNHSSTQIVLKSVKLLETFVKNCNDRFHYEVASKTFMETLMKLLKRKRGKLGIFDKIFKNDKLLDIIEFKILYMIQLWADTFMMHEDEFPYIMQIYRQLRKEGIEFPPRDKNERFMIQFKGKTSPLFDHLEEITKHQTDLSSKNQQQLYKTTNLKDPQLEESENNSPAKNDMNYRDLDEMNKRKREKELPENFDYEAYNHFSLDKQEVKIIQESLTLLDDIIQNASNTQDLKGEICTEIVENLKQARERIKMVFNFGSFARQDEKELCEELNKNIKYKFISYKEKYDYLKKNKIIQPPASFRQEPKPSLPRNKSLEEIKNNESPEKKSIVPPPQIKKLTPPKNRPNLNLMDLLDQTPERNDKKEEKGEKIQNLKENKENESQASLSQQNPIKPNNHSVDLLGFDDDEPIVVSKPAEEKKSENIVIDIKVEENKNSVFDSNPFNFDFAKVSAAQQVKKDDIDSLFD